MLRPEKSTSMVDAFDTNGALLETGLYMVGGGAAGSEAMTRLVFPDIGVYRNYGSPNSELLGTMAFSAVPVPEPHASFDRSGAGRSLLPTSIGTRTRPAHARYHGYAQSISLTSLLWNTHTIEPRWNAGRAQVREESITGHEWKHLNRLPRDEVARNKNSCLRSPHGAQAELDATI